MRIAHARRNVPRPTSDGAWQIDDKADNLDAPKMHQMTRKPRSYTISVQSIMGVTHRRAGAVWALLRTHSAVCADSIIHAHSHCFGFIPRNWARYCTDREQRFPDIVCRNAAQTSKKFAWRSSSYDDDRVLVCAARCELHRVGHGEDTRAL